MIDSSDRQVLHFADCFSDDAPCLWRGSVPYPDNTAAITEHIEAHRALEAIFEANALGIVVVRDGIVRRCNRKAEILFGYEENELHGRPISILYRSDADYRDAESKVGAAIRRGETHIDEREGLRKDGSVFPLHGTTRRIGGPDQERLATVWLVEDIGERHAVQAALAEAHGRLETLVLARTAELTQANTCLQSEIEGRIRSEERAWRDAHHDPLTGLPNRRLLQDRMGHVLLQAERTQRKTAVMFVDLDRFKHINDTLGHEIGDRFLRGVAQRLRGAVRTADTVARLGGDEFVVLLDEIASERSAAVFAERLLSALIQPIRFGDRMLHASASIGISVFPDDGTDAQALMRCADTAMYHAKECGGSQFQFYTEKMNLAAAQFFEIEQRLRGALGQNRFQLHYQPLIDLARGAVCGMEALIRWTDPEKGMIAPGAFIPVAEQTGLILPIGDWAIRAACRQMAAWERAGLPPVPAAVNLSPRQFFKTDLVQSVRQALADTGLSADRLEIEITESTLMQNADETSVKLRQLADMGVILAIDDFGTGYSSLSYLKRFPVHKLKIDQSFIRDLGMDSDDQAIVSAIVTLARGLGMKALAEGVETAGQVDALIDAGCDYCQGYYFARPHPGDETAALFAPGALASRALPATIAA